jgi:hypothetical protein
LPSGGIVIAKLEVDKVAELINQRVVGLNREVDKDLVIEHDNKNGSLVSRASYAKSWSCARRADVRLICWDRSC